MNTGDIAIVSFPHTDLISFKARPAVVIRQTDDMYRDVLVSYITSVQPVKPGLYQMVLLPDNINNLKVVSTLKVCRIATIENDKIKAVIGKLNPTQLQQFRTIFKSLVD